MYSYNASVVVPRLPRTLLHQSKIFYSADVVTRDRRIGSRSRRIGSGPRCCCSLMLNLFFQSSATFVSAASRCSQNIGPPQRICSAILSSACNRLPVPGSVPVQSLGPEKKEFFEIFQSLFFIRLFLELGPYVVFLLFPRRCCHLRFRAFSCVFMRFHQKRK
jgi:hypothetical protein